MTDDPKIREIHIESSCLHCALMPILEALLESAENLTPQDIAGYLGAVVVDYVARQSQSDYDDIRARIAESFDHDLQAGRKYFLANHSIRH